MKSGKKWLSLVLAGMLLAQAAVLPVAQAAESPSSAQQYAQQVAYQTEAEGIVLLKNENNCLPLDGQKVNVFGVASVNAFYGGGGSGMIDSSNVTDFYTALEQAGISYNTELKSAYDQWDRKHPLNVEELLNAQDIFSLGTRLLFGGATRVEMPVDRLSDTLKENAEAFSDTAIFFYGRGGSEGSDMAEKDLQMTEDERALLDYVAQAYEHVIVVFNVANMPEMGWLEEYDSIEAALFVGLPGVAGMQAVADVLSGKVNPSGRLADTIAYRVADHPSSANFGDYTYSGTSNKYIEYQESIYIGYRYFETFAQDQVQYPFGYGLSYTDFQWDVCSITSDGDTVQAVVQVTNCGQRAGKDVVQVYFSAPYQTGGLEKSAIALAAYAKTKLLAPGESQTVTLTYDFDDMASYDEKKEQAWVLDAGDYIVSVRRNVRESVAEEHFTLEEPVIRRYDDATGAQIQNLFSDVAGGITYFSRSDPEGTYPQGPMTQMTDAIRNADEEPAPKTEGTVPTTGAVYDTGVITLRDVYEDESLWNAFLDQLTVDEMIELVGNCGYQSPAIERLGIPATVDNDGPASIKGKNGFFASESSLAFPTETIIACTFNDALAQEMGSAVGKCAAELGTHVWYAPAANLHRNPMGGRNFEYYSEDPLLSGKMAAAVIRGAQSENLVVTLKHFALNDQETNRYGVFTWCNEQAMRELYLKPFEIAVKEADASGMMSGLNRIGTDWCGGSYALLTQLLREEWGFEGIVVTDFYLNFTGKGYMNPNLAVYAGNDELLCMLWSVRKIVLEPSMKQAYERDPIGYGEALRRCAKNICMVKMRTNAFLEADSDITEPSQPVTEAPEQTGQAPSETVTQPNGQDGGQAVEPSTEMPEASEPGSTEAENPLTGDARSLLLLAVPASALAVLVLARPIRRRKARGDR
ncbi:MAG TPA: glycoside hydrolase family 3 C-terminal domain-containing protein [Candidatus Fimivicinus intestinavium]|nr:glycoside hydrolase family 3 C-terminal domain-containing protein [Candidatus Fimivicinus intestinavium]